MVKKLIAKPKKVKKIKNNSDENVNIEKKPYSEDERIEKLRKDRIGIARRYEEMKLYDEAISYYKKLGMGEDVERVTNTKREIYIKKAQEFEKLGKLDDALRLYENLKMSEEVNRIKENLGEMDFETKPKESIETSQTDLVAESEQEQEYTLPEPVKQETTAQENHQPVQDVVIEQNQGEPIEEEPNHLIQPIQDNTKIFKICPYCGEELNLPKKPNFCPYCKEPFV
jgi:rubrerythrin